MCVVVMVGPGDFSDIFSNFMSLMLIVILCTLCTVDSELVM